MSYKRSKKTKRFSFQVNRNSTSHQTGANTFTITGRDYKSVDRGYSTDTGTFGPSHNLTMTVKEAKALQNFLNSTLS
jgi:hypothetical protein